MKTLTRMLCSFNFLGVAHRRRAGERKAGAARLGGAEKARQALKTVYWALAVVLASNSRLVHAQTPNTAEFNTASRGYALQNNATTDIEPMRSHKEGLHPKCAAPGCNSVTSDGVGNTAMGTGVLVNLSTGNSNTASGLNTLAFNTTGSYNTAAGVNALQYNTTGFLNTATGADALQYNTTGMANSAFGINALFANTTGGDNTALGAQALEYNTTGYGNTASGNGALFLNTTGGDNTALGGGALSSNTTGNNNTASGTAALFSNTTGLNNIAIGSNAGYAITGSNNIDIGSTGSAGESGVIRIGGASQTAVYIAGITSVPLTGSAVYVAANGQLGVLSSSERYKTEIASMDGSSTQKLRELRPVRFRLKSDRTGTVQYGLIAEEVNVVFPELVIRDEAGAIQGVRYDELAPMLLSEMQKQMKKIDTQAAEISELKQQLAGIQAALVTLQPKQQLVEQR